MTLRAFKCPYCGYRFRANPEEIRKLGAVHVTRKMDETVRKPPAPTHSRHRVDLTCPNCKNEFPVEVRV